MKKSFGNTDTPISGVSEPSLSIPVLNYNSDFRVKRSTDKEVVLVNTTTPFDQPESVRYAVSDIADIYKNAGLNSDQITGSKQGVSVVAQLASTVKVTSDDGSTVLGYLPVSAHVVLKVPKTGYIDQNDLQTIVSRTIGTLYENGTLNLNALVKGALNPKGL